MVNYVEREGDFLENWLKTRIENNREVVFLSGKKSTPTKIKKYKEEIEKRDNLIVIATYGIFSTGINIKNIHTIILASSAEGEVKTIQSVGRGLRLHPDKKYLVVYDLHDYLKNVQSHGYSRYKYYEKEGYNLEKIDIK